MKRINNSHPATTPIRTRGLPVGNLRAFEAVARHLNFRSAGEELALTQSAVTRQIQALESDVGGALFERHTRSVALTPAGRTLLNSVSPWLERLDTAVRGIRGGLARKAVSVSTFASFASMWVIPKLEAFQRAQPDIDISIDASDAFVNLDNGDVDLVLRYGTYEQMPKGAIRLFDDVISPMVSPWLLSTRTSAQPIERVADLYAHTLIEMIDATLNQQNWLTWIGWSAQHGSKVPANARWLRLGYAYQTVQAALAGQGVVLARLPLVEESIHNGALIEPLPQLRVQSPMAYWLIAKAGSLDRPEVLAFSNWLQKQAALTRKIIKLKTTSHATLSTISSI
jgi:LysR family transcriptional regulator, glycine cleavage system transcriptional activator